MTRSQESMRIIGVLRDGFRDLGDCDVVTRRGREGKEPRRLVVQVTIVIDEPDEEVLP